MSLDLLPVTRIEIPKWNGDDEIIHQCCCDDLDDEPSIAFCGEELASSILGCPTGPECVECAIYARKGKCPRYGRCRDLL